MMKTILSVLAIVLLCVCVTLIVKQKGLSNQLKQVQVENERLSSRVDEVRTKLDESEKVSALLNNNLARHMQMLAATSNDLVKAGADIAQLQSDFKLAQTELKQRDVELAMLKTNRDDSILKLEEVNASIDKLESQIAETKRKLANAEGDREYLLQQLKKLETEKADLLARWTDLAALRSQYLKLKEQVVVERRAEWLRKGYYGANGQKGAERLMLGPTLASTPSAPPMQVEVEESGAARVVPGAATSAPQKK